MRDEAAPNGFEVGKRGTAGVGGTGSGRSDVGLTVACIRARDEAVGAYSVDDLTKLGAVDLAGLRRSLSAVAVRYEHYG